MSYFVKIIALTSLAVALVAFGSCGTDEGPSNTEEVMVPTEDANGNPYNMEGNRPLVPYNGIDNIDKNPTLDNSKVTVVDTNKVDTTVRTQSLPDDSEMATVMNKEGNVVETRTFLSNKYLDKVVKTTYTPSKITLRVYLKNGKVVDVTEEKLGNFRTASARTILEASGFLSPPDPNATNKDTDSKKKGS